MGTAPSAPSACARAPLTGRWAIGDAPWRSPFLGPFEVLVAANLHFPLPWKRRHLSLLARAEVPRILISTVAFARMNPQEALQVWRLGRARWESLGIEFYDSRHLDGQPCPTQAGCCAISAELGWPNAIQRQLELLSGNSLDLSTGASVALHAFSLAALERPDAINLIGIDLPQLRKEYRYFGRWSWRYRPAPWITSDLRHDLRDWALRASGEAESIFSPDVDMLLRDFSEVGRACTAQGTTLRVLSPTSNLREIFGPG